MKVTTYKFTVDDYHRMREAGILSEDDRVELIEGEIVAMSPIGRRHASTVNRLLNVFIPLQIRRKALISVQNPVRLGEHSEPQPDVVLLVPREDFYAAAHPGPEDVLLLVEVVETSAEYDRDVKIPLYARFGIREVWLVDLEKGHMKVYRAPSPNGYKEKTTYTRGQSLAPKAFPDLLIAVEDILGPQA
ncbi:Uma2 family endonuclease [Candidatus Bipolaricaulota sp. J31]